MRSGEVVVIDTGRPDELQDFLCYPMHVDGERNAAVAHERDPEFLFLHPRLALPGLETAPAWLGDSLGEGPLMTN